MKKYILLILTVPMWSFCQSPETVVLPTPKEDSISVGNLVNTVWSLPFKHKDIVVAQAILETGWFKSKNFVTNNNLFGMKQVFSRTTTADTTINGYSHYPNWRQSVIDYYIKQSVRENIVPTNREEYFRYLDRTYSEVGPSYSNQLKSIITRLKLDNDDPLPVVPKKHTKKFKKKKISK